jgi:hypothetical protein
MNNFTMSPKWILLALTILQYFNLEPSLNLVKAVKIKSRIQEKLNAKISQTCQSNILRANQA